MTEVRRSGASLVRRKNALAAKRNAISAVSTLGSESFGGCDEEESSTADVRVLALGWEAKESRTKTERRAGWRFAWNTSVSGRSVSRACHGEVEQGTSESASQERLPCVEAGVRGGRRSVRVSVDPLLCAEQPPPSPRGGRKPARARAGGAGALDPDRQGAQPPLAAHRQGVRRSLPRSHPADTGRGAKRAPLRPSQRAATRDPVRREPGPVHVGGWADHPSAASPQLAPRPGLAARASTGLEPVPGGSSPLPLSTGRRRPHRGRGRCRRRPVGRGSHISARA